MNNKEVLKYCPNYYNIVNFEFHEDDAISEKLVNIYKSFIFSANLNDSNEVSKISEIDRVLSNYIDDYMFRGELQNKIVTIKIKNDSNILMNIVDAIINIFNNYEEYTTRKIYISKWI